MLNVNHLWMVVLLLFINRGLSLRAIFEWEEENRHKYKTKMAFSILASFDKLFLLSFYSLTRKTFGVVTVSHEAHIKPELARVVIGYSILATTTASLLL